MGGLGSLNSLPPAVHRVPCWGLVGWAPRAVGLGVEIPLRSMGQLMPLRALVSGSLQIMADAASFALESHFQAFLYNFEG